MKAALQDSKSYAFPNGRLSCWHAIVHRPSDKYEVEIGPACGIPRHIEESEVDAGIIAASQRCGQPGCKAAFAAFDSQARDK